MRATLSVFMLLACACVELPPPPSQPADSVALPFVCSAAGVPVVGGWIVLSSDDFSEHGASLSYWQACNEGSIIDCEMYPEAAIASDDLSQNQAQARTR